MRDLKEFIISAKDIFLWYSIYIFLWYSIYFRLLPTNEDLDDFR